MHPHTPSTRRKKASLLYLLPKTVLPRAHVWQVRARTGSNSGGLGRVGLGQDPSQQQLPPAKLLQGFGGEATNLGGVWEIPSRRR